MSQDLLPALGSKKSALTFSSWPAPAVALQGAEEDPASQICDAWPHLDGLDGRVYIFVSDLSSPSKLHGRWWKRRGVAPFKVRAAQSRGAAYRSRRG